MSASKHLRQQLVRHEGLRLKPYKCTSGKLTIGIGRNIEDMGISESEAFIMLDNDINYYTRNLYNAKPIVRQLNPARRNVLINMAFNLGVPRLMKFKKMWLAIEIGYYDDAANEMLDSKWANRVGNRAKELSEQMRTGEYQS